MFVFLICFLFHGKSLVKQIKTTYERKKTYLPFSEIAVSLYFIENENVFLYSKTGIRNFPVFLA